MASISRFSPADRLCRRSDLVVRPVPELRMCMVYRPKPARIITLNPTSWMLFELCNGGTVGDIEFGYRQAVVAAGHKGAEEDARRGLRALLDHQLVRMCGDLQSEGGGGT